MTYTVFDTENNIIATFKSYTNAVGFKMLAGRPDWTIKESIRPSTENQQKAVRFIESVLNVEFEGSITDFEDCRIFLSEYLDIAKSKCF